MPIRPLLSLVTLGVTDLDRSTRFYQALGWPLSSASVPGTVSFFCTDGGLLGLFGTEDLAADSQQSSVPLGPGYRGFSLAINLGSREEVDEALSAAVAAGATVLKQPQTAE